MDIEIFFPISIFQDKPSTHNNGSNLIQTIVKFNFTIYVFVQFAVCKYEIPFILF